MKPILILENIRSAYNVGTMIRTADALGYDVVLSWYTPDPQTNPKVLKSSLWAEDYVNLRHFRNPVEALDYVKELWYMLVVGELCEGSVSLREIQSMNFQSSNPLPHSSAAPLIKWYGCSTEGFAILVWNEATWVLSETIERADICTYIPMLGHKESLNVAEAASILMWELKM